MSAKNSAVLNVGFPIFGLRFINNKTVLVCGGGGEGNNGIPNKITAIKCSFNVSDKNRRLQKFREITLPSNEDSPMCVDVSRSGVDDSARFSIFVGCNQSTELIKSMSINNNLRKYVYTDEEHLRFQDAVQFDDTVLLESVGEYPRIVNLSPDSPYGAMMTSRVPSEIFIFNPTTLELQLRFKPTASSEIKDFNLSPQQDGPTLTYITASCIETISVDGKPISSSLTVDKKTAKTLGKYFFSKVRYVGPSRVVIAASLRNGKGGALIEYDVELKKIIKERHVSSKVKAFVAIDVSTTSGLIALAGNDVSVTILRLLDLKVVKVYNKLHQFAITSLSFSPNGKKLASGSASNTLNVLEVVPSSGGGILSFIFKLILYFFFASLAVVAAIFVQQAHERGELDEYIELSKKYGGEAYANAQVYGKIGMELSQEYGSEYYEIARKYGKIGFDIAKEKGLEGYTLIKAKVNEKLANNVVAPAQSMASEWVDQVNSGTDVASTYNDIVSEVTRNVDELTAVTGEIDTMSIISEAVGVTVVSSVASAATAAALMASKAYSEVVAPIAEYKRDAQSSISSVATEAADTATRQAANAQSAIADSVEKAQLVVQEVIANSGEKLDHIVEVVNEAIAEPAEKVHQAVKKAKDVATDSAGKAEELVDNVEKVIAEPVQRELDVKEVGSESAEQILLTIGSLSEKAIDAQLSIKEEVTGDNTLVVENLQETAAESVEKILLKTQDIVSDTSKSSHSISEDLVAEPTEKAQSIVSAISQPVESVKDKVLDTIAEPVQEVKQDIEGSVSSYAAEQTHLVNDVVEEVIADPVAAVSKPVENIQLFVSEKLEVVQLIVDDVLGHDSSLTSAETTTNIESPSTSDYTAPQEIHTAAARVLSDADNVPQEGLNEQSVQNQQSSTQKVQAVESTEVPSDENKSTEVPEAQPEIADVASSYTEVLAETHLVNPEVSSVQPEGTLSAEPSPVSAPTPESIPAGEESDPQIVPNAQPISEPVADDVTAKSNPPTVADAQPVSEPVPQVIESDSQSLPSYTTAVELQIGESFSINEPEATTLIHGEVAPESQPLIKENTLIQDAPQDASAAVETVSFEPSVHDAQPTSVVTSGAEHDEL